MPLTTSGEHVLLKPAEAASLLRCSTKALYALVERGQIVGVVRIGRRILIDRERLLSSLQGNGARRRQETSR